MCIDSYLFTLDLSRRRVSPLFVTICARGSVKPSDKSIEVSMSCLLRSCACARKAFPGRGSPTSADVSGWIMQIKGIPLDMTSREQSHHEWTVNLRRRHSLDKRRCTMHTAFADNPSTAGRLTSTTVLECPHDALSRTARRNLGKRRAYQTQYPWHSIPAYWQLAGDANINYHCR